MYESDIFLAESISDEFAGGRGKRPPAVSALIVVRTEYSYPPGERCLVAKRPQ